MFKRKNIDVNSNIAGLLNQSYQLPTCEINLYSSRYDQFEPNILVKIGLEEELKSINEGTI